jgi:hypothetical protein
MAFRSSGTVGETTSADLRRRVFGSLFLISGAIISLSVRKHPSCLCQRCSGCIPIQRLAALNAPHPAVWYEAMQNNPAQRRKSWYVRFFGIRYLPELLLRQRNFLALAQSFKDVIVTEAFTPNDLSRYRAA